MKKIFTFLAAAVCSLTVFATDYTDTLVVTVNGESVGQNATISVTPYATDSDGNVESYTLSLKNFVLDMDGQQMGIGNITLEDCYGLKTNRGTILDEVATVNIEAGDDPNVSFWLGPLLSQQLGGVPITLRAAFTEDSLLAVIDIDLSSSLQQIINVRFSTPKPEETYTGAISSVKLGDNELTGEEITVEAEADENLTGVKFFVAEAEFPQMPTKEDFTVTTVANYPYVGFDINNSEDFDLPATAQRESDYIAVIVSYAADLSGAECWFVHVKQTSGINGVETDDNNVEKIYSVGGQRTNNMQKGQVYILKNSNGKTRKVVNK